MHRVIALVLLAACTEYDFKVAPPTASPGGPNGDPTRAGLGGSLSDSSDAPFDDAIVAPPPYDAPVDSAGTTPEGATDEVGYTSESIPAEGAEPGDDDPLGEDPVDEDPPDDEDPLDEDPGPNRTPGRVTGNVWVSDTIQVKGRVYCDPEWAPDFRIGIGAVDFVLDTLDVAICLDDPAVDSGSNVTDFDTLIGEGRGTYGAASATVWFTVSDGGESADSDHVTFEITTGGTVIAGEGYGRRGNLQAHPPVN